MNAEQKESFRLALLRVLDERASERFGLTVQAIQVFLGQFGFRASKVDEVNVELQYLADKGYVVEISKTISPENRCWRITAEGRDFIAQ
ncbi:MAG: hypothetical protein P4N60_19200 [Verrucomicrobiae bacterium]|nr:hypothetical protein [Verrucomicrobiae bacterium]